MFAKPLDSYKQMGLEADIRGSDPHRLITLLFEGIIVALRNARVAAETSDIATKTSNLTRAIEILNDGLIASLDIQQGGELAEKLKALYQYMVSRLISANFKNDLAAIVEVEGLLGEIYGAWQEIRPEVIK